MGEAGQFDCARDRHLFGPGPKRILALDGGGVRGAISVAFLERIETLLSRHYGKDVRLGDWFDFVGGTSTGALIAGALALGYRTADVRDFYIQRAPTAFKRPLWRIPVFQAKFDTRALRKEIESIVQDRELQSHDLITGLCVISKRMDTGSPWVISNNPRAPYWSTSADGSRIGNGRYKLANLVRASTAAPHFFDPEILPILEDKTEGPLAEMRAAARKNPWLAQLLLSAIARFGLRKEAMFNPLTDGLFVDGGVTPHNNPSLALFMITQLKAFGLCWPADPQRLSIASIGTGTYRPRLAFEKLGLGRFPQLSFHALMSLMSDAERLVLMQMQWLGECPAAWEINSEIGDLAGEAPPGGKMFRFLRYDLRLEREWLRQRLDVDLDEREIELYRCMDEPDIIPKVYELGQRAAEQQVKLEHWVDGAAAADATKI